MGEKLQQGDRFPRLALNLINGDTLQVPEDIKSRYLVLLFYRGYW